MPEELHIVVAGSSALPEDTRKALVDALAKHGDDVVDEAGRVAASQHSGPGNPMITPGMIVDSNLWLLRGFLKRRQTPKQKVYIVIGLIATYVGGVFTNNITKSWGAIGFVICALILLGATFLGSQ